MERIAASSTKSPGRDEPVEVEAEDGIDGGIFNQFAEGIRNFQLRFGQVPLHFTGAKKGEHARIGVIAHIGGYALPFQRIGQIVGGLRKGA